MTNRQRLNFAFTPRRKLLLNGVLVTFLFTASSAFPISATTNQRPAFGRVSAKYGRTTFYTLAGSKGSAEVELPENEFSRTFKPDRILKTRRGYSVAVTAEPSECEALAKRFDLSNIAKLTAELTLQPELIGGRGGSASGVEVEGTCWSTVTQRCVRTNEDFQVDLEFPIYSIVRPVVPASFLDDDNDDDDGLYRKTEPRGGTKSTYRMQDRNLDEMDVMELQRMLQYDISDDDVMEDEAIFPLDGMLDVGELVAQLFWLKLDPYPKKPGTDPVQRSITG